MRTGMGSVVPHSFAGVGSLLARGTAVGQGKAERNVWKAFWKRYHNALELLIATGEQLNKLEIANLKRI